MEPLNALALPHGALLLIDTAPIVYVLEQDPQFAKRFEPLFARHEAGELQFAVTTITLAEVLVGPLMQGEEALAKRYRDLLESWQLVSLTADIAEMTARVRARYRLKLPDAVQVASALSIDAYALITHDRDFAVVRGLRIYG
jgi:predicted nucleic acid-binding protein